ncbi:MAG: hypothetical protein CM1200mP4_2680 [Rhodospirillaceae bacterium]|nr:MAG: hypothetical protein CM1200mP4_2680 [Rhodospirillaceae bacterium]
MPGHYAKSFIFCIQKPRLSKEALFEEMTDGKNGELMCQKWPVVNNLKVDKEAAAELDWVVDLIGKNSFGFGQKCCSCGVRIFLVLYRC